MFYNTVIVNICRLHQHFRAAIFNGQFLSFLFFSQKMQKLQYF